MEQERISEKRREQRYQGAIDVVIGTQGMPGRPVTALYVSASGLYCVCDEPLGDLTRVDVSINLDDHQVMARAVVIREEELPDGNWGIGLFFTRIRFEDRQLFASYVNGE
ncbi:MAG TPA: PilZ domain-containing protein [Candidatus Sabulitectum sp.]|nr:PilZ domain-containing protein [Candidatus Sabulitectum sp.]